MATLTVEQFPTLAADLEPVRRRMSYTEFLAWSDEDTHAEWIPLDNLGNGEVIIYMPPKHIHQMTLTFLNELLSLFVRLFDLGRVGIAPFEVKLKPDGSAREPDIFFVAKENLNRFSEDRLNGPADLVIEIVSRSSVKIDRDDKYKE